MGRKSEDTRKMARLSARLINEAIKDRPKDMAVTIHLCRGNYQSSWLSEGGYDPVAEILLGEINVDGYFLEYDDERSGDFKPLRFLPKGKKVVLGLVSSKFAELESKDALKSRIDEAAKSVPLDQLAISPQCGFGSTAEGNVISVDGERKKLELCVAVARDVWGGVTVANAGHRLTRLRSRCHPPPTHDRGDPDHARDHRRIKATRRAAAFRMTTGASRR